MSAYTDIESALAKCGQGEFEKLIGALLDARGVKGLSFLGSVVGKNKTRTGVPDIFASSDGKTFSFVACTTETGAKRVESKLLGDVADCSNPAKTGVPIKAIDVVYLAFNSVLGPEAQIKVAAKAESCGLRVKFISASEIAGDLSRRYTWLAQDFFGIQVDSNQILSVDAFVQAHDKGLLAAPLDTRFLFREDELNSAVKRIDDTDLIISGNPGTGKTRFALELVRHLEKRGWHARCIFSNEQPLMQDIQRHFSDSGQYVVLLDDANKIDALDPVVKTIRDLVGEKNLRVILTVRNYAHQEILSSLTALRRRPEAMKLGQFSREETEKLLDQAFNINNPDFKRQIWLLSKGNARIATMAAKLALEKQSFAAITNLTELYDAYYRALIERADSKDTMLIPVLALLSVLKSLRKDAADIILSLEQTFNWNPGSLWKSVTELHRLECVDLHGNRLARVSDQILASYAFFLVFVERRSLSFRSLVELLGTTRLKNIRDIMFSIQSTMDRQRIQESLIDDVRNLLNGTHGPMQMQLLQIFWDFDPDLALTIADSAIDSLPSSDSIMTLKKHTSFGANDILTLLANFAHDPDRRKPALHLALQFLKKQPESGGQVLSLLTDMNGFGIHKYSESTGFQSQKDVLSIN